MSPRSPLLHDEEDTRLIADNNDDHDHDISPHSNSTTDHRYYGTTSSSNGGNDDDDPSSWSQLDDDSSNNGGSSSHHNDRMEQQAGTGSLVRSMRSLSKQLSRRLTSFVEQHTGSIGMLGSVSIAVNTLTGPAMLTLPAQFVKSGIIPTCACLVFVCCLSSFCCLHMAQTISRVGGPGNNANAHFTKEVEYSDAFRYYWGERWYYATQVLFFICVTCLNISSIVDTAHVVDTFFGHWWPWGGTAAIRVVHHSTSTSGGGLLFSAASRLERWSYNQCTDQQFQQGYCLPFVDAPHVENGGSSADIEHSEGILFTLGGLVTTAIFLPMALMDLKENAAWQVVAFIVLLLTSIQFMVCFAMSEDLDVYRVSMWGSDWKELLGVVLFNYSLVIAIPAWLYEREPHVDVPTVVHGSSWFSTCLYVGIGLLGAMAMPHVSSNMLESMMSGTLGPWLQLGASIFEFYIVGLGIPLFSVLNRLNLMGTSGCSRSTGNALAVYLPFAISWFLYDGGAITALLSWGGVIFTSLVAFILPISLALYVVEKFGNDIDDKDDDDEEEEECGGGTVSVYFGYLQSVSAQITCLRTLLVLASLSVVIAILGNCI